MWWIIVGLIVLATVVFVMIILFRRKRSEPEIETASNHFRYTEIPLINGSFDAEGEPNCFKITIFTGNHKVSFDVNAGQISSYAFRSENGNKIGNYEVG